MDNGLIPLSPSAHPRRLLIAQGEHPKVIQERLGHASIKITLDTYGHLFDGLDEAAADRPDEAWRASRAEAPAGREAKVTRLSTELG